MTGVAFSGDPVTPTRCSTSTTYPAIGMRTQVGRRSWARNPSFAIRLPFSCTASRRESWGDACHCATPLALQQGLPGGREPGGGTNTAGGAAGGGGHVFFLEVQEPRAWHSSGYQTANDDHHNFWATTSSSNPKVRALEPACGEDVGMVPARVVAWRRAWNDDRNELQRRGAGSLY